MDMTIKDQLRMARGLTRSNRKLTVTPLRCRDRRLVHRPFGADSLDGNQCGLAGRLSCCIFRTFGVPYRLITFLSLFFAVWTMTTARSFSVFPHETPGST